MGLYAGRCSLCRYLRIIFDFYLTNEVVSCYGFIEEKRSWLVNIGEMDMRLMDRDLQICAWNGLLAMSKVIYNQGKIKTMVNYAAPKLPKTLFPSVESIAYANWEVSSYHYLSLQKVLCSEYPSSILSS